MLHSYLCFLKKKQYYFFHGLYVYFKAESCDICIIETGLGGKFDATNIIDSTLAIITSIGIDHTEFLGTTIDSIANLLKHLN